MLTLWRPRRITTTALSVGNHHPEAGPLAWTAPGEEGVTYVICGVSVHCSAGNQKLAITVSNSC